MHYDFNDVTKNCQRNILNARDVRRPKSHVDILSLQISRELFMEMKLQSLFQLQAMFPTNIIPVKHAVPSTKLDAKHYIHVVKTSRLFPDG